LKWPKSDVNSFSKDWRQHRFALFDNSVPPGHNSSPLSLEKTIALAGSRGKKSDAGTGILP
jgi:hypothetical protein